MSRLVVLYGAGGLSDVGRHAILAALEQGPSVESVKVLTRFPELLQEKNWNSMTPEPHTFPKEKVEVVGVKSWSSDEMAKHLAGATGVVSCLGNRQPGFGHWESEEGNKALLKALPADKTTRCVVISSMGVEEDWPPMEFHFLAKFIMSMLFIVPGLSRGAYQDLTKMEKAYRATSPQSVDYLLVRPVGLGEDVVSVGKWCLQKEKYKDVLGTNIAKLDCARFMVQECLKPTKHREAVVIGSDPATP